MAEDFAHQKFENPQINTAVENQFAGTQKAIQDKVGPLRPGQEEKFSHSTAKAWDDELNAEYQKVMKALSPENQKSLRAAENQWIRENRIPDVNEITDKALTKAQWNDLSKTIADRTKFLYMTDAYHQPEKK